MLVTLLVCSYLYTRVLVITLQTGLRLFYSFLSYMISNIDTISFSSKSLICDGWQVQFQLQKLSSGNSYQLLDPNVFTILNYVVPFHDLHVCLTFIGFFFLFNFRWKLLWHSPPNALKEVPKKVKKNSFVVTKYISFYNLTHCFF